MNWFGWFGRFYDKHIVGGGGHRSIGVATLYGFDTAMHGAIEAPTRWGWLVISVPRLGGKPIPWGAFLSPNGTPWAATWLIGPRHCAGERRMARVRRALWGHGYSTGTHDPMILDRAIVAVETGTPSAIAAFWRMLNERTPE